MTSLERVLTAIGQQEGDRVPYFLLLTMHGAKELGMSIEEYFSKAENVCKGQVKLREKYGHDCYYSFFYAPVEVEAFGGEVVYSEDGPPNSGTPVVTRDNISSLTAPDVTTSKPLQKVFEATRMLKEQAGDEVPIIGVVMSPFSLPVMQMGFENYLDLIYNEREKFEQLMKVNEEFCVNWANAQLEAGATAICYFDPVSSTTIIPRDLYLETGYEVAKRTIGQIKGPTATHFASGKMLPIMGDVAQTGTAVVGVSTFEDLTELKTAADKKLTLLGNLNAIEMRRWSPEETEAYVKEAIRKGAKGGGFILAENHGEIPFQIEEETLLAIRDAVQKWGQYPLDWIDEEDA
ncbi:MAG: uroporphyrinogen decarboxylase family protein [Sulfurimonadaceae bacterium]|nr:uroporphyrinogen decarboxylase family protein [Sulfurimonadaceae bacterium]